MATEPRKNITQTTAERMSTLIKDYYAKKTDIKTKTSELTNDAKFQTEDQVNSAIKAAVAGSLHPSGSVAFANLPALNADNLNKIVNVTDKFTTTADFVEGANVKYPAGTNVAIINVGTAESPSYKYDVYTGVIDTSGFMEKVSGGADGDIILQDANGNAKGSGKKLSDYVEKDGDKVLSDQNYTLTEKQKLAGITEGATKVEESTTNGNIKINGAEKTVYTLPDTVLHESDISDYTEAELRTLLGLPAAD